MAKGNKRKNLVNVFGFIKHSLAHIATFGRKTIYHMSEMSKLRFYQKFGAFKNSFFKRMPFPTTFLFCSSIYSYG